MTDLDRGEDLGMRQVDAIAIAGGRVVVEGEGGVVGEFDGAVGELADAQLRTLEVGEDADRPADLGLDGADVGDEGGETSVVGVAHVDAEHVRTRQEQLLDGAPIGGDRTQGRKDLDPSIALHLVTLPQKMSYRAHEVSTLSKRRERRQARTGVGRSGRNVHEIRTSPHFMKLVSGPS